MFRRLMLVALALCALVALAGCGANRLMGPVDTAAVHGEQGSFSDRPREDDPRDPGADPVYMPTAEGDTLRTSLDEKL